MSERNRKCEGCYLYSESLALIRVTNGALTLCSQCLDDVNRKNPELSALRADNARLRERAEQAEKRLAEEEAACLEEIAEKDFRQDVINRLCTAAGHAFCFDFEWSSRYGFEDAIRDVGEIHDAKEARIAALTAEGDMLKGELTAAILNDPNKAWPVLPRSCLSTSLWLASTGAAGESRQSSSPPCTAFSCCYVRASLTSSGANWTNHARLARRKEQTMSDDETDGDDISYGLILPFLDDDPRFAHGVEVGILYERMKHEDEIAGTFLTTNQEQITLLASRLMWTVDEMEVDGDDFRIAMHK